MRYSTLPPEVQAILARTANRAEFLRTALTWYVSQGQALARIEATLAALAARLDRLEARLAAGAVVAGAPGPAPEAADLVARQAAALAAWVED